MKLSHISINTPVIIVENKTTGFLNERLQTLGFLPGNYIKKIQTGKKNLIAIYEINHMMIALRSRESDLIWTTKP